VVLSAACLVVLAACERLGPNAVQQGMPAYNEAIARTGTELMLLNFVRMRYSDSPYFLEVSNVFAAPRVSTGVTAAAGVGGLGGDSASAGASLAYSENPIIVYTPMSGEQFAKRLLEPIGLENIGRLHRGGWNMDLIFRVFVQRINNVWNAEAATGPTALRTPPRYKRFNRVVAAFQALERDRLIDVAAEVGKDALSASGDVTAGEEEALEFVINPQAKQRPDVRQLLADLELDPAAESYFIADTPNLVPGRTLAIVTRTPLATMFYLSKGVVIPDDHLQRGLVHVTQRRDGTSFDWLDVVGELFVVDHAREPPADAHLAVSYRGYWFYIADDNVASKDTLVLFNMLLLLRAGEIPEAKTPISVPIR